MLIRWDILLIVWFIEASLNFCEFTSGCVWCIRPLKKKKILKVDLRFTNKT